MHCLAMDVTAREGEPCADGKLMCRARGAAQNDFGGENVASKPRQGGDLYPQDFTEGAADPEMVGCDMERYVFHKLVGLRLSWIGKLRQTMPSPR